MDRDLHNDDTAGDRLIEEMLGGAGPKQPDLPILLGMYSPEEAEACGAFHDPAAARAPELRGWGVPYRPPRSIAGAPNMAFVWTRHCATVLELFWKIEHHGHNVSRDQLALWRDGVLAAREEMHRALQADPELLELLDALRDEAWCITRKRLGEQCRVSDPYRATRSPARFPGSP